MTARRTSRTIKTAFALCLAAFVAVALTACGTAPSSGANKTLGFVVYDVGVDPWMNVAISTVQEEAEAAGYKLSVVNGHNDIAQMSSGMDQLVTQKVDAILLAPSDQDSMTPSIKRAEAAGIPVIAFSLALSEDAPVSSFVGTDDVQVGREQAKMVAGAIGNRGNVALMTGILGSGPQIGRSEGFRAELQENFPDVKLVEEQPNNWANDKTISLTQDWLAKYPAGQINAVVAQGPELAAGARLAKSMGRSEIVFVGNDYPEEMRESILAGDTYGTINGDPKEMAREAVAAMLTLLDGGTVQPKIFVPIPPVTSANVADSPAAY
ncbi:sugar ABC transporter substrate-binding protein [Rhodococcus erythropolis]|uniref:sugar ABC transporter substrate-binding protein n=1 Tax=Rhodococcus TaxID=1827 RepID=UPI000BE2F2BE|nr:MULTISPECIES: sugar ABC transporter substrate-binding protein [Rhodococcus]ATI31299.1 hypothetical protein CPI83_04045 [Rhodococcus sp. H-CA8f]MBS2992185.1 sugar ABC transporter substrate-binding protein [Rhodococcus erythropolis]MDI9904684.1 sugar ABC transporter substrate-binding protein [Rhodococcus sp. IEGM 1406]MDJ0404142.1 sugar ABC transporter substrate-binding protein [Rhodococcus erythropolis]MQP32229.1 substrate-binding domain-containing protein [Rhodococcus erythropolis]